MAKNAKFNPMRDIMLMSQDKTINSEPASVSEPVPALDSAHALASEPAPASAPAPAPEFKAEAKEVVNPKPTSAPTQTPESASEPASESAPAPEHAPVPEVKLAEATLEPSPESTVSPQKIAKNDTNPAEVSKTDTETALVQQNELKPAANSSNLFSEFYMVPSSLNGEEELVQCGFVLSRKNRFFIKKMAIQNGVNLNTILATLLKEQYDVSAPISDEQVMNIEDAYYISQRTNVKMTFIVPKVLKDFLNLTSAEYGLKISTLLNHYVNLKREEYDALPR